MKTAKWLTISVRLIIFVALLAALLGTVVACEDLGLSSSGNTEETEEEESNTQSGPVTVNTKDTAMLAVYRHLLELAESPDAKTYLSDFYENCDNWYAESEYFKDGSDVWNVVVDMTEETYWNLAPYWRQASWFILKNGEVIPSNLFQANALRIEADLQALVPESPSPSE
jgi:hypothetical protein